MPAMLFTVALATGRLSSETIPVADPARISVIQDLSAVVSGAPPFSPSATAAQVASGAGTGSVTLHQTGAGIISTSIDTGLNSVTLAATAVSARIVLPNLSRAALP